MHQRSYQNKLSAIPPPPPPTFLLPLQVYCMKAQHMCGKDKFYSIDILCSSLRNESAFQLRRKNTCDCKIRLIYMQWILIVRTFRRPASLRRVMFACISLARLFCNENDARETNDFCALLNDSESNVSPRNERENRSCKYINVTVNV